MSADHWYLLPVGFGIAVLAMSSGVSAGNFWVPVYLLWARFDPPLAFWMTLATMLCGYGSGVVRNLRQGTINRRCLAQYLPYTVPAAVVGGYLAPLLSVTWLILLFGVFVLSYSVRMFVQAMQSTAPPSQPVPTWEEEARARLSPDLREHGIGLLGGVLLGLITVGLGELLLPRLLAERKALSPAEAVGSTVLVIFVTSVAAALVRLHGPFLLALGEQSTMLLGAMLFAGPGVLLGGQLGPMLARRLNPRVQRLYVAAILWLVGCLLLVRFVVVAAFSG
jgi:uncharacterized membrane protein YfcA